MVADVSDESSLNAMCSSAKIVLNCVGPVCGLPCKFFFNLTGLRQMLVSCCDSNEPSTCTYFLTYRSSILSDCWFL